MSNHVEIRVAATTPANNLASSIVNAYANGKDICLSAIGPVPVATALKAVCIANRTLVMQGVMFVIVPALVERPLEDRATRVNVPWVVTILRLHNILEREYFDELQVAVSR